MSPLFLWAAIGVVTFPTTGLDGAAAIYGYLPNQ